ncbi:MAG: archease [Candidatus Altiarchaeota archaeon]|nr:archease [Candidatus Altiarchaeota archaeon]
MTFEFLDHTADIKIRAKGKTLVDALSESGKALYTAIAGESKIEAKTVKEFTIKIHKPEMLVHHFLTELIFLFSTEHFLASKFDLDLKEAIGYKLTARVSGEIYDPKKHKLLKEVKAATYHELKVAQENNGWVIEVVCDT